MSNENVIIYTETTGISKNDEILELSILTEDGKMLFSNRIKPAKHVMWKEAEQFNKISPAMVENCKTAVDYKDEIEKILDKYSGVISHNTKFHINMLQQSGINIKCKRILDVGDIYARYIVKAFNGITQEPLRFKLAHIIDHYNLNDKFAEAMKLNISSFVKAKTLVKILDEIKKA